MVSGIVLLSVLGLPIAQEPKTEAAPESRVAEPEWAAGARTAVKEGIGWLRRNQHADGFWSAGKPLNDVGTTGLALLAFVRAGQGEQSRAAIERATRWLLDQQDNEGLIGTKASHVFHYSHAIATLALCEAARGNEALAPRAQKAIDYIERARNPYKVWRYFPRDGDNDTSVTGWKVMALAAGKEAKLAVSDGAYKYAALWFDEVTDPKTGRAGYTKRGEASSRLQGMQQRFPPTAGEALTAMGASCRLLLGQPGTQPVLVQAAGTILQKPPVWSKESGADMCYWFLASTAMARIGGEQTSAWSKALLDAALPAQRQDGESRGSWDPIDPWGSEGGRAYATAMLVLSVEACLRGARAKGK
jgi:hypothetical protein